MELREEQPRDNQTHAGENRRASAGGSDASSSYSTTRRLEAATRWALPQVSQVSQVSQVCSPTGISAHCHRHMPLASSTTTLLGEERREDCWQAALPLCEVSTRCPCEVMM